MSKVTSIIVDYNSLEFTEKAIKSLLKYDGELIDRIIVVDNFGITDYSSLFKISDKIMVLKPHRNLGFGRAINLAMEHVKTPFVLLQNPDTELKKSTLHTLIHILENNTTGAVTTVARTPDGMEILARRFTKPRDILAGRRSPLLRFKLFKQISESYRYSDKLEENSLFEVEAFTGTFVLLKSKILHDLNGFDTRFFLFMEDIDLSRRIRDHGYKILCSAQTYICHFTGATRRKVPFKSGYSKAKSVYIYFKKWNELRYIPGLLVGLLLGLYTILVAFIDIIDVHRPEISWKKPLRERR